MLNAWRLLNVLTGKKLLATLGTLAHIGHCGVPSFNEAGSTLCGLRLLDGSVTKGEQTFLAFWDQRKLEWGGVLLTLCDGPLSVDEAVLLGRIEDRLATISMPIRTTALDWKAWC